LPIEVGQDSLFDYLWVGDVTRAVVSCAERDLKLPSYNVCSGVPRRLVELAELVREASGKDLPIRVLRPGLGRAYGGDPEAFRDATGWSPSSLPDKVAGLYAWYEEHRGLVDRHGLVRRYWRSQGGAEEDAPST